MLEEAIGHADALAGEVLERAVCAHHRRRLARIGRLAELDPPRDGTLWCGEGTAPREGNDLDVLIDGADALPAITDAIEQARSHVHIAGWHLEPGFAPTRGARLTPLRELLAERASKVDVRVLLWAGAPVPLFTPSRGRVRREREELVRGTRINCALDAHERPMHCHHEKLVIVDDEVVFAGGIDLTALGGDRYDSSEHSLRSGIGWHDVATRMRGPALGDLSAHFRARWHAVTGESPDGTEPAPAGGHTVQVLRTIPERIYDFAPRGEFRILEAYTRALRAARRLVYLESQFLWSPWVVEILAQKLRQPPSEDFRLVVVLPARPNNGRDMTRGQLGVLAEADSHGEPRRFLAATVSSRSGALAGPLYVHAKVGVVDDAWLTVGSANLNDHSFFNDTEINVHTCDEELARTTRLRLWAEHLERPIADVAGDPAQVVDELWRPIAREQLQRRRRGDAATHRLLELPGVSRRSMALLGPLDGLFVDG